MQPRYAKWKDAMLIAPLDSEPSPRCRVSLCLRLATLAWLLCPLLTGCAAVSNPVASGILVSRLPPEYRAKSREEEKTIPLPLLRQKRPDVYRLGPGDVLGVYIEGVLGDRTQPPPVRFSEQGNLPPATGFPIPVQEDGTLSLPLIPPIKVEGMTLAELREALRKAYEVDRKIIKPEAERFIVSLIRPRQYHVLVVREDSGGVTFGQNGVLGGTKRGTGTVVELAAYENDVLNALTRTGGLPGLDAMNEVVVQRGYYQGSDLAALARQGPHCPVPEKPTGTSLEGIEVTRIPLRQRPDEPPPFKPEDVILRDGDIVFIGARDTELFYVGGLLLPRQFILPRDYDLTVVGAIALAGGPLVNGGINANNLSGAIVQSGLGSPSPSAVTILRRTAGHGQVKIKVDLNHALNDPDENLLVQAGDVIILQETVGEALTRYLTTILRFEALGTLIRQRDFTATTTLNAP
jgi:protein involved in polysaccharide export with SLBB domain